LEDQELFLGEGCDAPLIFESRCAGGICHSLEEGTVSGGVDLISDGVAGRLLDQPATYPGLTGCPTEPELLVNSADPSRSLMLLKLTDTHACGDAMPVPHASQALSESDYSCVSRWVVSIIADGGGAAATGGVTGSGGAAATGGAIGSGGTAATGGATGSGGALGTGGAGL
jgi:hypothetical protein